MNKLYRVVYVSDGEDHWFATPPRIGETLLLPNKIGCDELCKTRYQVTNIIHQPAHESNGNVSRTLLMVRPV